MTSVRRWSRSSRLSKRLRLDAELLRRGLAGSRTEAKRLIELGHVTVRGLPATRPATLVATDAPIALRAQARPFVSRGGDKLDDALARLGVEVAGRRWLDAGASSGGFTDRLLQGGAAAVVAVDVGYGQLHPRLRADARVIVLERTNARTLTPDRLPWAPDGVVADLSFISLRLVLPALRRVARRDADFLLLVKPQFEAGRAAVPRGGVVRDPETWRAALARVVEDAAALGLGLVAAVPATPPGPAGNREFFTHFRPGHTGDRGAIERAVEEAKA